MTRDEFLVYISHFNNKRYDELVKYFTDDIVVTYFVDMKTGTPKPQVLNGPAAFVENYKHLHDTVEEKMELGKMVTDGKNLYVELWTEFHFKKDTPDFSHTLLKN